jgi:PPIC-type PPIASE domain
MIRVRRLLREPLVHFLAIGAVLVAVSTWVDGNPSSGKDRIDIGPGEVESLALLFQRTWQRPPTRAELDGLIEARVREEVLYREALKLGLDRGDTVVRRRLQQKMEFVGDDLAAAEPSDAELQAFLAANAARFREPERWSFRQVFVASEARDGVSRAEAILASLRDGNADPTTTGDATLLQPYHENLTARDVAGVLGEELARALGGLPVGVWAGPVRSPYGLHLVEVTARVPARDPTLAEVRPEVLREWQAERGARAKEELYVRLRSGYEVMIELPPALDGTLAADGRAPAS